LNRLLPDQSENNQNRGYAAMLLKTKKSWEMPEAAATPEAVWMNRRDWLKSAGYAGMGMAAAGLVAGGLPRAALAAPITGFPADRNLRYRLDRDVTLEKEATTYTNFYEFGSSKNIWKAAAKMQTDPWMVMIDGMVDRPMTLDAADLVKKLGSMEERLYRFRCVEAWAMAVPWTGVPLARLVSFAQPKAGAKYLRMETFLDKEIAPGQAQSWYPWPYVEGVTLDEARNELAFLATGIYGKPLPNQNGAPIRLVLPWKYGFKSIKSIVRFTFTDQRPISFWEELNAKEYGFWANVHPGVPHPRWRQNQERMLGTSNYISTQIYNGYEAEVGYLYQNMETKSYRDLYH